MGMEWSAVESIAKGYLAMAASPDYGVSRDGRKRFNAMLTDPLFSDHSENLRGLAVSSTTVSKPSFTMGTLSPDGGCFFKQSVSGVIKSAPIGKDRAVSLAMGILKDAGWQLTIDGSSMVGEKVSDGRDGWASETPGEKWYRENKGK